MICPSIFQSMKNQVDKNGAMEFSKYNFQKDGSSPHHALTVRE